MTVRKLMAAVAVLGVALAAFRVHFSVGSFVAGALSIAWLETAKEIKRKKALGVPVGPLAAVGLFGGWVMNAALIIIVSMIPLAVISPLLNPVGGCRGLFMVPTELLSLIAGLCLFATVWSASTLRRWLGSEQVPRKTIPDPLETNSEWDFLDSANDD